MNNWINNWNTHFSKTFRYRVYIGLGVLLVIAIIGITFHIISYLKLWYDTEQQAVVTVTTIKASENPPQEIIILPGNVQAWHEATIYARTNGYLTNWYKDIGAQVKTGDLLAEISAPEVDSQLRQTEAQIKTAEANYQLAKITAKRWINLSKTQSVSQQETDEKISDEKAQAAIVASTRANRDRLRDLVSFQKIVAPFDGVIMSRMTDIGRLINAGSSGSVPLFRLVQSDRLRAYVRVPQNYAARIVPGLTAQLHFAQHPGKVFLAKLMDTAKAIDPRTRTMLIQLQVNNIHNELFPGSYTEAHLILPRLKNVVIVPVNTLIFQKNGLQIATVTTHNQVIIKKIMMGRDFGNEVEVITGLRSGEEIILNPPDSLISGQKVRVVSAAKTTPKESKS